MCKDVRIEVYNKNSQYYSDIVINDIINDISLKDFNRQQKSREDILHIEENIMKNGRMWIALNEENKVVGFIALLINDKKIAYAKRFFIIHEYRGTGLSTQLFDEVIEYANSKGIKKIYFGCLKERTRAINFYNKYGFKQIKQVKKIFKDSIDDVFFVGNVKKLWKKTYQRKYPAQFNETKKENKQISYLFIFLALFSLSTGLWENYKSVWLQVNNISIPNISYIISGAIFLSCIFALLLIFVFKKFNIVSLIKTSTLLKFISMLGLVISFNSNLTWLITTLFFIDAVSTSLVSLSIYPFLTQRYKNSKMYNHRKLIEYICCDVGILLAGIIVSFKLASYFEYNVVCIFAAVLAFVSLMLSLLLKNKDIDKKFSIKRIFSDKIVNLYLVYIFIQQIAYNVALGLQTLLLKDVVGLTASQVAIFLVLASLLGDAFGYFAMYKMDYKNHYISYSIKYGLRFLMYLLVALTGNIVVALVAIALSLLVSRAWENVCDGVYINRIDIQDQFGFASISYAIGRIGVAIGIIISGALFGVGLHAIFGVACSIMIFSMSLHYYLIHLRQKEEREKKK